MDIENREMIIENIEKLMRSRNIIQAVLVRETGIPQPQMSKCLNRKAKGQFTLEQIRKIADYFHVSIDSLIGRESSFEQKDAPSAVTVCRLLMQLLESDMVRHTEIEVEESMFTEEGGPDPAGYPYTQQRCKNKYTAFYFSNYSYPDIFDFSDPWSEDLEYEFGTGGNYIRENAKINDFMEYFLKLYDLLQKNDLPRDIFETAIADRLKSMEE